MSLHTLALVDVSAKEVVYHLRRRFADIAEGRVQHITVTFRRRALGTHAEDITCLVQHLGFRLDKRTDRFMTLKRTVAPPLLK